MLSQSIVAASDDRNHAANMATVHGSQPACWLSSGRSTIAGPMQLLRLRQNDPQNVIPVVHDEWVCACVPVA
jgi:hypothetical protein